ncbi:AraC family transcriptional regulator [Paenibacillus sp. EC2-1]|uniref:AraC family transcriptional regulator n=1 Tax=Paenibacillus sp. EC2-1 TaxID=3388665 RepID=UPI003BEF0727
MIDSIYFGLITDSTKRLPVYLTITGQWNNQETVRRPSGFSSYQWLFVLSGEGVIYVDGQVKKARAGQAICLFPDEPHHYHAVSEPWSVIFLSMEGSQCSPLLDLAGVRQSDVFDITDFAHMKADLLAIIRAASLEDSYMDLRCSKLIYNFLLDLAQRVNTSQHTIHQSVQRLQPVIQYIKQQCQHQITIEQLAAKANVTPQYLCYLFKQAMNVRPMEYVNRERINLSKQLIFLEPHQKIREIAKRSGFEHPSYFCTVFKRLEGMTPEEFKRFHGYGSLSNSSRLS